MQIPGYSEDILASFTAAGVPVAELLALPVVVHLDEDGQPHATHGCFIGSGGPSVTMSAHEALTRNTTSCSYGCEKIWWNDRGLGKFVEYLRLSGAADQGLLSVPENPDEALKFLGSMARTCPQFWNYAAEFEAAGCPELAAWEVAHITNWYVAHIESGLARPDVRATARKIAINLGSRADGWESQIWVACWADWMRYSGFDWKNDYAIGVFATYGAYPSRPGDNLFAVPAKLRGVLDDATGYAYGGPVFASDNLADLGEVALRLFNEEISLPDALMTARLVLA